MTCTVVPPRPGTAAPLARFFREARASVLVEFAYVLPLLVALAIGTVDFGRYILLNQKLHRTTTTVSDLAAREEQLSVADLDDILEAAQYTMTPFSLQDGGVIILTVVLQEAGGVNRVVERRQNPASATLSGEYGDVGSAVSGLPAGLMTEEGDVVVIAETRFRYDGWMVDLLRNQSELYHVSFFRPRGAEALFTATGS